MNSNTNTRLSWQQAVEEYTEEIVNLAEKTIRQARMEQLKESLGTAQLSNFLGVTLETGSVAAIVNWVRYQMGRKETKSAWENTNLGKYVLEGIEEMRQWAIAVAKSLYEQPKSREVLEIHLKMIRLYAGYLKRWYIAEGGQK